MSSQVEPHTGVLKTFRDQLFDEGILHSGDTIGTDDETLMRFLRARRFNLMQAKKMIADCQEWRKSVEGCGLDELYRQIDLFDYPEREAVFDCWPMGFHKTDKEGRPMNITNFGSIDLPKLHEMCSAERHWHTILVTADSLPREILPAASRQAGKHVGSVFVIADLKGFGLRQFWQVKYMLKNALQMSQDYYPEILGKLVFINAPSTFTATWAVIKSWLSQETIDKIHILGSDYKDVLLDLVDADCLPTIFGGACECKECGGCYLSSTGPWLDERAGRGKNKASLAIDA